MPRLEDERLFLQEPTLEDQRRDAEGTTQLLLVWGQLPAWMVMDEELRMLLRGFDGRRSVRDLLAQHARRHKRPLREVTEEALPILQDLLRRRILTRSRHLPAPAPEPVRIANVTVNLTNRCNLSCPFCYNERRRGAELEVERLMDGIERGRRILSDDASFIVLGGEPLTNVDRLCEALERAEDIFTPPALFSTNGTLLSDATVARLRQRRVHAQVSLDSPGAEIHDALRGRGVHAKAVAGIRRLKAAGIYTIMSMVYTRRSTAHFEAYLDLAAELGADEARFIPLRTIGGGVEHQGLRPNQAEAFEHLLEVLERRPELTRLLARDYFSILSTMFRFSAVRTNCGLGRKVVFIDADGGVYLCPNHVRPDRAAGNLRSDDLAKIVQEGSVFCAARERFDVANYHRCQSCPFRYWCAGDCRGEVEALGGNSADPSPYCSELRTVYRRILWLLASGRCPIGQQARVAEGTRTTDTFT
ncbi:MAG: radical SAM protein [Polyangiaceae bacterium]|nr:radical SAM protein [Polyangiaceae bacterium]